MVAAPFGVVGKAEHSAARPSPYCVIYGSPCVRGHRRRSCSSPKAEVAAVHEANQASWQISIDQPQPLVIGLFIRDVAGGPSRNSWLPRASPAVPHSGDQAPDGAGFQWDYWWNQAWFHQSSHCNPAPSGAWSPACGTAGEAGGSQLLREGPPATSRMNRPMTRGWG